LKKLHAQQARVYKAPGAIVSEYVAEVMAELAVEPGDAWGFHQYSMRIHWGKLRGLQRVHYHLSHILALSMRGEAQPAQAYMVQLLRCLHQVCLDQGSWEVGSLLLPKSDPLSRTEFGGTLAELEVVDGYREALKKLSKQGRKNEDGENSEAPEKSGGKGGGAGGKK
jgi:hypothetical protein